MPSAVLPKLSKANHQSPTTMPRLLCTLLILLSLAARAALAQDMPLTDVLIDGESWQLVAEGFKFTEGPAVDAAGNLYFTDIPNNRIHKVDAGGKLGVFVDQSGGANGLMFGPDGRLYACQNGRQKIVAYDSAGEATTIADGVKSNDLVVNRQGDVYFTDPENHQVWLVKSKGEKRVVDTGIGFPNGVILWPGQGTLVVADTRGPHLWTFRIEPDGSLAHKQPYYTCQVPPLKTESGADGLTVDTAGRLYATSALGLQMFDPTGRLGGAIAKPQNAWLSNVCFGGPKLDTLYVTCGDKVYRRKTKATGVVYASPAEKK
jgi:sugar lactone lactonase YvrE